MAARLEFDAEPLPGYRLIERLGGGGFGEVWKCIAPGGMHKAIKFVHGDLDDTENGERAEQELKALARVKTVRHPYILSLERYDIIKGQLIIVMELADRNLWDRFKECRAQGLPGIPREELLNLMEEAAEALDLMNGQYQLQHLDIKPQNLFLIHNHIKVADFGLVKDLEGLETKVTGGITPVYAAPETFDGIVSRHCDQYSLAICYQELLTGQRPFSGTNVRQLILQHIQAEPDVSILPEGDRPIILRALSKRPGDRFPTCQEMIQLLRDGGIAPVASPSPGDPAPVLAGPGSNPPPIAPSNSTQSPSHHTSVFQKPQDSAHGTMGSTTRPLRAGLDASVLASEDEVARSRSPSEIQGDGCLFPALVIGMGQTSMGVLRRLRERLTENVTSMDSLPNVKLLFFDTDPDTIRVATQGKTGAALVTNEVQNTPLNRPSHYLRPREGRPSLESWISQRTLYRIPRSQMTTGVRALGRLAFHDNYRTILRRIEVDLDQILAPNHLQETARTTQLGIRTNRPRVYLVVNLAGGTSSGMFLDMAYSVRALLRQRGYEQPDIVGVLLVPSTKQIRSRTEVLGNTFAALTELRYFASPGTVFTGAYHDRERPIHDPEPPFTRTVLLQLPEDTDEIATRELQDMTGQMLYRELVTPLGRTADLARADIQAPTWTERGLYFQTFGLYRLSWPRQELLREVARQLGMRLVVRWMSKDSKPILEKVSQYTREQWLKLSLGPDVFIERLQEKLQVHSRKDPETALLAVVEPLVRHLRTRTPPPTKRWGQNARISVDLSPEDLTPILDELERLLGKPGEDTLHDEQGQFGAWMREASEELTDQWSQTLAEMTVRLLEEPEYRLAGAEESVRLVINQLEQILQQYETLSREIQERAAAGYQALDQFRAGKGKLLNFSLEDIVELIRTYPKARLQSLILRNVIQGYLVLRGHLSDELREIGYCRNRLADLHRHLETLALPTSIPMGQFISTNFSAQGVGVKPEAARILLPGKCKTLSEAIEEVVSRISPETLIEFDHKVTEVVRERYSALVNVCMTHTISLKEFEQCLLEQATLFATTQMNNIHVADLFLSKHDEDLDLVEELRACLDEAAPQVVCGNTTPGGMSRSKHDAVRAQEFLVLVRPAGATGDRLQALTQDAADGGDIQACTGNEDVVFYRELVNQRLAWLEHLGEEGLVAYRQMILPDNFTPHTRLDIDFTSILDPR